MLDKEYETLLLQFSKDLEKLKLVSITLCSQLILKRRLFRSGVFFVSYYVEDMYCMECGSLVRVDYIVLILSNSIVYAPCSS